ncbi:MAG: CHAP domain-containing protein [Caulobacteraceae bacterium]|nr:CHAP domain-containing protein [Caulobacteraceae bacterium]
MRLRTRNVLAALACAAGVVMSPMGSAHAEDYLQCVPFARTFSGIQIFGDAYTWWQQASGKYNKGFVPKTGAVLVFKQTGIMNKGHVAVVSQVLTDRVIQVTHANWSVISGTRGKVEKDVTVIDVSQQGDWSSVKVWYDPVRDLGNTVYPTYGFIYSSTQNAARYAAQNAVMNIAQTAFSQVAAAVPTPGSGPAQMLNQAADTTDQIAALIASLTGGEETPTDKR